MPLKKSERECGWIGCIGLHFKQYDLTPRSELATSPTPTPKPPPFRAPAVNQNKGTGSTHRGTTYLRARKRIGSSSPAMAIKLCVSHSVPLPSALGTVTGSDTGFCCSEHHLFHGETRGESIRNCQNSQTKSD